MKAWFVRPSSFPISSCRWSWHSQRCDASRPLMKSGRAEVQLAAQFQSLASFHIITMYGYQESRERLEVMAISINSSTSGFRKWCEAQELRKLDDTRGEAVLADGIASPDVGQEVMTPDQTPHRPWLVPGAGKL